MARNDSVRLAAELDRRVRADLERLGIGDEGIAIRFRYSLHALVLFSFVGGFAAARVLNRRRIMRLLALAWRRF